MDNSNFLVGEYNDIFMFDFDERSLKVSIRDSVTSIDCEEVF